MQRELRRKDRAITEEETRALLEQGEYGILATVDTDGQPYGTPLSYVVMNNAVYIHCATLGQKVDNMDANPAVCFTVVGPTEPVYETSFSTYYSSCMVFGKSRLVTDDKEKKDSLMLLAQKYLPEHMDKAEENISGSWKRTAVYAIDIDRIAGKAKKKNPA